MCMPPDTIACRQSLRASHIADVRLAASKTTGLKRL